MSGDGKTQDVEALAEIMSEADSASPEYPFTNLSRARAILTSDWLAARERAAGEKALRDAARYLRQQGSLRFDQHGPDDARGAALWDAGCAVDPDDGNAIARSQP